MEVVLVRELEVDVVVEVIEGVSKVVVMKEVSTVNLDDIAILHLLAPRDDNVLEIIVVPKKRNCVGSEKWIGLIVVKLNVVVVQVTVLGWADLVDVGSVFYSIPRSRWICLFRFPKNKQLEGSCVFPFQLVLEVGIEIVVVLGGLGVHVVLVEEIVVLVWRQQRQMFSLCLL